MIVGRSGGTDDKFHGGGVGSRLSQELPHSPCHQVRRAAALFGLEDVACLDADTFHYPLVAGIYYPRHLLIVKDIVGHIPAHAGYYGIYLFHLASTKKVRRRKGEELKNVFQLLFLFTLSPFKLFNFY